jgi:hypothetical protein
MKQIVRLLALSLVAFSVSYVSNAGRVSTRHISVQKEGTTVGRARILNFGRGFTTTCVGGGSPECDVSQDINVYVEGDTTPANAPDLPTSGTWTVDQDVIQISGVYQDPDTNQDLVRAGYNRQHRKKILRFSTTSLALANGTNQYCSFAKCSTLPLIARTSLGGVGSGLSLYCDELNVEVTGNPIEAGDGADVTVTLFRNGGFTTGCSCDLEIRATAGASIYTCSDTCTYNFLESDDWVFRVTCNDINDSGACPISAYLSGYTNVSGAARCFVDDGFN